MRELWAAAGAGCRRPCVRGRALLKHLVVDARAMLDSAAEALALSARAYHRVVKAARTIADISAVENVEAQHLAEALRFRPMNVEVVSNRR